MEIKKVKKITQILAIIPCVLLLGNNTLFSSNDSLNDNLKKTVKENVIETKQKEIAITIEKEKQIKTKAAKAEKKVKVVKQEALTEQPKIFEPVSSFSGQLTAYVGNCPECSGVLACTPRHVVSENGIYFNDSTFGNIRIVATSSNYPCGSIIRFNLGNSSITAVAMDRGVHGNVVDLLTDSTSSAYQIGRRNIQFEVLRMGW